METRLAEGSDASEAVVRTVLSVCPQSTTGTAQTALDSDTDGIRFKAKVIGMDPVPCADGDKMCWDSMMKLKGIEIATRKQGKHKQKIWLKVSSNGLRIYDEWTGVLRHEHEWSKITSLTKDHTDPRALSYVYQQREESYCLFYIRMANLADPVLRVITAYCARTTQQQSTDTQNIALLPLEVQTSACEDVLSPDSNPVQQSSLRKELMQVFAIPLPDPLTPSETANPIEPPPVSPEPEFPPQPMFSNSQIVSMFSPRAPAYPPTNMPWGQQWAAVAPWPTMAGWAPPPSGVAPAQISQPPGPTAPPAGTAATQTTVDQNLLM